MNKIITQWLELFDLLKINKLSAYDDCIKYVNSLDYDKYPLRITESLALRIKHNIEQKIQLQHKERSNINDLIFDNPILKQFLPQYIEWQPEQTIENIYSQDCFEEKNIANNYILDPLCEENYQPIPGLIHKYSSRVLLLTTANCPVNCRFCFRRYVRQEITDWNQVIKYLTNNLQLREIILSGGEPLLLNKNHLSNILEQLSAIKHIKRLRIHTRLPITLPELIDKNLLELIKLQHKNKPLIFVIHCNHPQELDNSIVQEKILALKNTGINILNQTVLLKNINDNLATLSELSEKLCFLGVLPYYLHILDHVKGAEHFFVSNEQAKTLHQQMQENLSGYLVPKLVQDVVGAKFKINL